MANVRDDIIYLDTVTRVGGDGPGSRSRISKVRRLRTDKGDNAILSGSPDGVDIDSTDEVQAENIVGNSEIAEFEVRDV